MVFVVSIIYIFRHEFLPFAVKLERPEVIEKLIKESNHFEDHDPNSKLFEIYNKNQALQRQWIKESREFHEAKALYGDDMPYQTLGGFRRASRSGSPQYEMVHKRNVDNKQFNRWKGVIGEENMPKTLAEFQELKYNNTKRFVSLQEKVEEKPFLEAEARKVQGFKRALENGEINTKVRQQKQDEHIPGTKARKRRIEQDKASGKDPSSEFKDGIDVSKIISDNIGKGKIVFNKKHIHPKEFINYSKVVGYVWDRNKEKYVPTKRFEVVYSKDGVHAYPVKEIKE